MANTKAFSINSLVRENIRQVVPYSSARDEYGGDEGIFLDANENAFGSVTSTLYNRYPDPYQKAVKAEISAYKGVMPENIFLGNGSDEGIDLLIRAFCNPGQDNIIYMPPTYGMYKVSAQINNIACRAVPLTAEYQLDTAAIQEATDEHSKIIFICSPNNPSGNLMKPDHIYNILNHFNGLVVIDEAYIDFVPEASFLPVIAEYPNLVVLQTFSKVWGLAGIRLGMLFADPELIRILNKIKPPYNINSVTQQVALEAFQNPEQKQEYVKRILEEKAWLQNALQQLSLVERIYPSDANFLLVKMHNAHQVYEYLSQHAIVVRDRSNVQYCEDCLRITVGTRQENEALTAALKQYK